VLADQNTCDGGSYNINGYSYTGVLIRPVYLKSIQTSNYTCVFNRSTSTELGYQQWIYDYAELALDGTNDYQTLPFLEYNNPWGYTTMPSSDPYPGCLSKLKWKELNQIVINKTDGTLIKGFNFSYNNNTYERLMLRSLTEFGSDMSTKPPYLFNYIQPATQAQALPPYLAEENDHYGFYNGQFDNIYFNGPNYIYYDGPNNDIANIQQYYNYRQPNFTFMQIGTLNKIVYPTGATTEFTYEANDYSKQVNLIRSSGYTNLGTNNVGGGLRIKKISSYDPSFPNSKVDKQYFYVSNYNNSYTPGNTNYPSSGVLGEHIQYDFTYPEATSKSTATYYQSLFSTESVLPGSSNSEGSPVGYSEVVEKLNDGSYTKYFFTNFDNGYLDEPTVNIQSIQTAYDPYTSNEEERGKQSKIEVHNSSDVLIKSNVFSYTALNKATDYVPALHGRSFFTCGAPVYLDEGDAYKIYTYSYLLSQNIETVFDSNGANPVATTKNYYYDNSVHKQVTRSEIIDSKKQSQMVVFNYPGDMVNLGQTTPYQDMVNRNIVNPVIQQIVKVNGVTQNTFTTQFTEDPVTNLILPSTFQTQAQANPAETRSNFLNYDPNGNLLSFSNDNKPAINYVWSFYGHYPIAKIENADYATVAAVLGGVSTVNAFTNSSPTSASITSFLAPLRTDNRLQNAFITSYNYSPDVGMTSSTDSEGKTQSYEYDNFQRLQNIKDPNGSIITHYKYHFSGVPVTTPVIYKNLSKSGLFYGDCGNPPTTTIQSRPVIYTVPEGTYTSTVSQADADLQAQNDVNLNGQNYANTTHTCW
jgi:YD repeat-containing protein